MDTTAPAVRRLSIPEYAALCWQGYLRHWKAYTLPLAGVCLLSLFIRIDINYTESLPHHVFVTVKGWTSGLKRGDYVAYRFPTENPVSPYRKGARMVKIVGGVAGDEVQMDNARVFSIVRPGDEADTFFAIMGGHGMGIAKEVSRRGLPLEPGPVGIIPEGAIYIFTPHQDSLDSRYAMVGWIQEKDIIGRTFALF
jgi:conjugal transfer pilin signal peptidase TrbI